MNRRLYPWLLVGRRPVVISMALIAALIPLGALFVHQPLWLVFVLFALGAAASGVFPLVMATIASDTGARRNG